MALLGSRASPSEAPHLALAILCRSFELTDFLGPPLCHPPSRSLRGHQVSRPLRRRVRRPRAGEAFANKIASRALRAAGICPAVPTRVATAGSHHPPAALGALLGILEGVEQRRLAGWRRFHRHRRSCGRVATVAIALRQPRAHLSRQDPDLLLLIDGQEL